MTISVFDLFKIGIGPSSSHTVGPMLAANRFIRLLRDKLLRDKLLRDKNLASSACRIEANLYGSLAATGKGHNSDVAVVLGLSGELPDKVDPNLIDSIVQNVHANQRLALSDSLAIQFNPATDIVFRKKKTLPGHPNGMEFLALDDNGNKVLSRRYYSVGGGFVVDDSDTSKVRILPAEPEVPHSFRSAEEMLAHCDDQAMSISELMLRNERFWRADEETLSGLQAIWQAMQDCVVRGCRTEGVLPGKLNIQRRAHKLHCTLQSQTESTFMDPLGAMDWVNLYALAVNEENASGGRVVTAPTNGAAGIIPAVMHFYRRFTSGASDEGACRFLLTAGAIGILYKENASLSGAEVGCQGEVGVACSMAAGALTEVLGGTPQQVENAAEIGMEHNLGLTCDPVGGLVQIPCIERNAMAAIKAINASRLALRGDGHHYVTLDKVIKTMHQTGKDMKTKYKETSRGGLALNVIEC